MSPEEEAEQEFAEFFDSLKNRKFSKEEMRKICEPILPRSRITFWRVTLAFWAVSLTLVLLYRNVDRFAWTVTAVTRLGMIQILPFWDWTYLYGSRCLIERPKWGADDEDAAYKLGKYETNSDNCMLCENFDQIDTITNAKFSEIERNYLEQGHPVRVTNATTMTSFDDFVAKMQKAQAFVDSEPCEIRTNLMLRKAVSIAGILEKMAASPKDSSWFVQLRNCDFAAVKSSRMFVQKTSFHPVHLPPFYSSWVLISRNTPHLRKELYLSGLVIVQQIYGELVAVLSPKDPCGDVCAKHEVVLSPGQSLVFSTDLWIFEYLIDGVGDSIATIVEINWNV